MNTMVKKGKWQKKKCTYSIDREVANQFDLLCRKKELKRYDVVEKLIKEFNKEFIVNN